MKGQGEKLTATCYSFALDHYEVLIVSGSRGEVANFQKISDYIVNSVYVR